MDKVTSNSEILKERMVKQIKGLDFSCKDNVIEFGCCDLRPYSEFLIEYFDNYVGCDVNDDVLNIAKKKVKNNKGVKILKKNIETPDFEDCSFDLIVCNNMLAYTNKEKALKEMYRILVKGGVIISLFNNNIGYSLGKVMLYRKTRTITSKKFIVEFIHSFVVILNTIIYRVLNKRYFRTTYSTISEFEKYFTKLKDCDYRITKTKLQHYSVIDFIIRKADKLGDIESEFLDNN